MPTRRRIAMVTNAAAAGSVELREAVLRLRSEGQSIRVFPTWESGDGVLLAQVAVKEGYGLILAAGGDGTLHEVANGVLASGKARRVSVGVLPFGTGNDFLSGCCVPFLSVARSLRAAVASRPRPI